MPGTVVRPPSALRAPSSLLKAGAIPGASPRAPAGGGKEGLRIPPAAVGLIAQPTLVNPSFPRHTGEGARRADGGLASEASAKPGKAHARRRENPLRTPAAS